MPVPNICPFCNAENDFQNVVTRHVFGQSKEEKHAFFHCNNCDIHYQYPKLKPEEEAQFYASEFEDFMESRSGKSGGWNKADEHVEANEATRLRRMKYLNPFLDKNKKILEVGCSSGFMLYPLIKDKHICSAIEPSGIFSNYVKKRGISVYNSFNDLIKDGEKATFDLIMHFFVLEHISDPLSFINLQLKYLKPGGKIIFEIPNVADPLYSIYDIPAFERFYWSKAHPWYFSEKSLEFLLKKTECKFEIKYDQRYDLSNHMFWAINGRPGGMGIFTDLLGSELEDNYKENLIKIKKCDTLIGIIHKD
jgi:SAM-dependent methyltransferase